MISHTALNAMATNEIECKFNNPFPMKTYEISYEREIINQLI